MLLSVWPPPSAPAWCRDQVMSPGWHQGLRDTGGGIISENQSVMDHGLTLAQCWRAFIKMETINKWKYESHLDMRYDGMLFPTRISLVRMLTYLSILLHACPMIQFISGPDTSKRIPRILDIFTKSYRHYTFSKPFLMTSNDLLWMKACNQIQEIETLHVRKPCKTVFIKNNMFNRMKTLGH